MNERPRADLAAGMQVGDYLIDERLATGGTSTVYAATHPLIGKRAAVKVLDAGYADEGDDDRLLREARAVNRIGHPSVVDVFACGRLEDGRSFLIMELLEGETLAQRSRRIRLSNEEIYEILLQLSDVLDRAHALDLAHLDLKPENIFLVPVHGGRTLVKLLDFGLASPRGRVCAAPVGRRFRGTPEYASPEQAVASEWIDGSSDIYSLGIVAFELFTGRRPFTATSVRELLLAQLHEAPRRPSLLCADMPALAETLVLDMLEKTPQARPTAAEVRERLLTIRLASLRCSTLTMPPVAGRRAWHPHAAVLAAIALTLCALAWRYASRPLEHELVAPAGEDARGPAAEHRLAHQQLP